MAWVAGLIALAAAAASEYNSEQVAKKQDNQAAAGMLEQGRKQKEADSKVDQEVQKLKDSNSSDERAAAMQNYMTTLTRAKQTSQAGLSPTIGSAAFQGDATKAAGDVAANGATTAGLMARIDAPTMQRQGEGFDYGNLATDLSQIARQAQGQDFLNQLRIRAIRRNPYIDMGAAALNGYAGAYSGSSGTTTSGAASPYSNYGGATYSAGNYGPN